MKIYLKNISIGTTNPLSEKTKTNNRAASREKDKSKMYKRIPFLCQEKIYTGVKSMSPKKHNSKR